MFDNLNFTYNIFYILWMFCTSLFIYIFLLKSGWFTLWQLTPYTILLQVVTKDEYLLTVCVLSWAMTMEMINSILNIMKLWRKKCDNLPQCPLHKMLLSSSCWNKIYDMQFSASSWIRKSCRLCVWMCVCASACARAP